MYGGNFMRHIVLHTVCNTATVIFWCRPAEMHVRPQRVTNLGVRLQEVRRTVLCVAVGACHVEMLLSVRVRLGCVCRRQQCPVAHVSGYVAPWLDTAAFCTFNEFSRWATLRGVITGTRYRS